MGGAFQSFATYHLGVWGGGGGHGRYYKLGLNRGNTALEIVTVIVKLTMNFRECGNSVRY